MNSLFILGCNPTKELCCGPFGRQLRLQLCQLLPQRFVAALCTVSSLQRNGLNQEDWFYILPTLVSFSRASFSRDCWLSGGKPAVTERLPLGCSWLLSKPSNKILFSFLRSIFYLEARWERNFSASFLDWSSGNLNVSRHVDVCT